MRFLPFIAAFGIVLGISSSGIGYRTLWADEQETAERARSIIATGLPTVYDPNGNLSLNAAGREIEEGNLHRYTPWLQFYVAAAGLKLGPRLGLSPDASVRSPFVTLHAATCGLVADGLITALSLGPLVAVGIAVTYGVGSVQLIHARTARYHALTSFLFFLAWSLFGTIRRRRAKGDHSSLAPTFALGLTLIALLHSQTIVGLLGAAVFSLLYFFEDRFSRRTFFLAGLVVLGVVSLFLLTRPWLQGAIWGPLAYSKFHSLKSWFEVGYSLFFFVFSFLYLSAFRTSPRPDDGWRHELLLAGLLFFGLLLGVRIFDFHPFSQVRYYLPMVGVFLFWPIAIGGRAFAGSREVRRSYVILFFAFFLFSELSGEIPAFQGLRLVHFDFEATQPQPLREAVAMIQGEGTPGTGVFSEYTPQTVNWYLPEFRPALIPDRVALSSLGRQNASLPAMVDPEWYLGYTNRLGYWVCDSGCDSHKLVDSGNSDRYSIIVDSLGKTFHFCVVRRWQTADWNNAPRVEYLPDSLTPNGPGEFHLVLAKRCP
jgi:hypothetical protein